MVLNFEGILLAVSTFLIIGLCHPLVIKTEYYFGTKPWWIWLVSGLSCCAGALFVESIFWSALLGGAGSLVSMGYRRVAGPGKAGGERLVPYESQTQETLRKIQQGRFSVPDMQGE